MKYRSKVNKKYLKIAGFIVLLLALPISLILIKQTQDLGSSAATPDKLETEIGVLSSSGVSKQSDSNTSGGQYVLFNRSSGPTPPPSVDEYGPRYDLYDGQVGGNFPQLGTIPSGNPISWDAGNVYIVPDWVAKSSDVASDMATWILRDVPDGVSKENPTYIVFDRTRYGAGTSYTLNGHIKMNLVYGSVVRRNLVFWGYNAKLNFTTPDNTHAGLLGFGGGGWENISVLGFEIDGPGSGTPSYWADGKNGATEGDIAVDITSFSNFKLLDNYVHHTSQLIDLREWRLGVDGTYGHQHHDGWAHGPYSSGMEIGYNELYNSMNQGVGIHAGWNIDFHHNYIHDVRQKLIDFEEPNRNRVGTPARRIVNLTIRDNRFGDWSWQKPAVNAPHMSAISFEQSDWWQSSPDKFTTTTIDSYENVRIQNNLFDGQPRGIGNPTAEVDVLGYWYGGDARNEANRSATVLAVPPNWQVHVAQPKLNGFVVNGNVSTFPQWLVDLDGVRRYWSVFTNGESVTVENNDFQGMDWRILNVGSIIWNNNGNSTYLTW